MTNSDIVHKLWNLCDILRDDGINYSDYVTELVQLLFIKMEHEQVQNKRNFKHKLPAGSRWSDVTGKTGDNLLKDYQEILSALGQSPDPLIAAVYGGTQTRLTEPRHLEQLIKGLDSIDWFSAHQDGLGDLYEGLLEKNANETKSGAGQYFTPRALIDSIISCLKPRVGETIQDPAAGTAGFLIAADAYIKETTEYSSLTQAEQERRTYGSYIGIELVSSTRRLALMNCLLHGMESGLEGIVRLGNALSQTGASLPKVDIILSNPPFGTAKGGGGPTRNDLPYKTSNKQLAFLQHIYKSLKPGGRAAVVIPDNVMFEAGVGTQIRRELMDQCNLHTILRLPTGIFYAQGVKTNVLFFQKGTERDPSQLTGCTERTWIYDLRTNMPNFGKRTPFNRQVLEAFEAAYGEDPNGNSPRFENIDGIGRQSRYRVFTRHQIMLRDDSLDLIWLDPNSDGNDLSTPELIAGEIMAELTEVFLGLSDLMRTLGAEHQAEDQKKILMGVMGVEITERQPHE
ncbi:N-6 DNA methylase [Pseudomonas viridiflava]|uniref:class I SAM-dependent DNA methyltransferase n=3 Tax=Pseudomonas viridiflava TaxID=33069 RepID=UPI000F02545C|nr:N-6 DNA methylase [Pseudomonas viridiflava]